MVLTVNSKHVVNFFAVNGTVQILTTLPRILFEKKIYRLLTVRINFTNTVETLVTGEGQLDTIPDAMYSQSYSLTKKLLSCVSKQTFVCGQDTAF